MGAILGVALNAVAYQALYSGAILLSGREDPSRAVAVVGSFALYIACVALAQGATLTLIQRRALLPALGGAAFAARPGWRWALATFAELLTYYPLLLFGGQPPFDWLGLPTAAQPGLLNAATLYGALVTLTAPIGVVVGAAQGLAVYGRREWALGFRRGWAPGGPWRWLAVNTLAWGFAWPLGLLLGNTISFFDSFIVSWVALACVTSFVVVGHIGGAAAANKTASGDAASGDAASGDAASE